MAVKWHFSIPAHESKVRRDLHAKYWKIWSIFEEARTFGWILSDENPRKVPPKIFKPPLRKFDRSYF